MTVNTEKQIVGFLDRQKAMILTEESFERRCLLVAMWKGFLIGMQITNAISIKEYRQLEQEIKDFAERINQNEENTDTNISSSAFTTKVASSC